jgi:hypothetical protein
MSQYASASRITLQQIIVQAEKDCAERRAAGKTMTASYFIEDGGKKFVVTVTPADQIQLMMDGRRSIQ